MARAQHVLLLVALSQFRGVSCIGCFVCQSLNGSDAACEDPYNSSLQPLSPGQDPLGMEPSTSTQHYQHPCFAFRKERKGLFPADHCIKINGKRKIGRISHCGSFKYEGHFFEGCVQSCDSDGCNAAWTPLASPLLLGLAQLLLFI